MSGFGNIVALVGSISPTIQYENNYHPSVPHYLQYLLTMSKIQRRIEEETKSKMKLTKNEIEKILYKEKPVARNTHGHKEGDEYYHYYTAKTSIGDVNFKVPQSDMGTQVFKMKEPAQLLRRWIVYNGSV